MSDSDKEKLVRILILIGGIIGLIEAIIGFFAPRWFGIIGSIVAIFISLIILAGVINIKSSLLNWIYELSIERAIIEIILGILLVIFGSGVGGILVIVGGVLRLILL